MTCGSPTPASPAACSSAWSGPGVTAASAQAQAQAQVLPRELPRDALEQVLLRCDADTLVGAVPAVCRAWRAAASAAAVWKGRLAPRLQAELEPLSALGPALSPGRLHLILQGRNLLRNPTFRKDANSQLPLGRTPATARSKWQRSAWVTTAAMGDGVAWELPPAGIRAYGTALDPQGAPPLPLPYPGSGIGGGTGGGGGSGRLVAAARLLGLFGNGSGGFGPAVGWAGSGGEDGGAYQQQGCLATGNDWCEVVQVVDLQWELQRRGLSAAQAAHLLDAGLGLRLAVHVGSRWDCVGQYCVGLVLDEGSAGNANGYGGDGCTVAEGDDVVPCLQSFVMRPTRHHFWLGRAMCTSDSWQRFEYTVPACPRGFRRAVIMLRGRRAPNSLIVSPMPRFPGAKFSAAELLFC
ncbi:hypothetical protein HYH02_004004 [Chlamydomonas schloesseri]|uniref:F-box domain-containing protein n=1 Tax=Chlamydomonas schloesseri TaxID=2026947 RepID=A0A836B9P8_9CHLO|nr:hypothetical protein HYH02_004004 [Chlamydomonas schloesseri]|eukprot:KAG2451404.1 hypothetical protein HYH02_004004 [Chlamydomonas schloesseri]